jgi:hypothetical protein
MQKPLRENATTSQKLCKYVSHGSVSSILSRQPWQPAQGISNSILFANCIQMPLRLNESRIAGANLTKEIAHEV